MSYTAVRKRMWATKQRAVPIDQLPRCTEFGCGKVGTIIDEGKPIRCYEHRLDKRTPEEIAAADAARKAFMAKHKGTP